METTSSRKRPEDDDIAGGREVPKRPRANLNDEFPAIPEYDDDGDSSLLIEEEMINEVTKRLEEEIMCPCTRPPATNLTHTGNEESCGPYFSNSGSSVMASIDMGGSSVSYFCGECDASELSAIFLVSPVIDSGVGVVGNVFDSCPFSGEGSWFIEEDNFWVYGLEAAAGNDLVGGGGGFDVDGDKESEQEWLACALNEALFEFGE